MPTQPKEHAGLKKAKLFLIGGMSYYCDYSVTIYSTGYPDYLVTVRELDNELGTINMSFCKEELMFQWTLTEAILFVVFKSSCTHLVNVHIRT